MDSMKFDEHKSIPIHYIEIKTITYPEIVIAHRETYIHALLHTLMNV